MKHIFFAIAVSAVSAASVLAQGVRLPSGAQYRKTGIHNANQVRTVFGNWGVIAQPCQGGPRGAWKYDNDGYLGDASPFIGAEVNWHGSKFYSVETCPVNRPTTLADQDPRSGKPWTMEPVAGYFNANGQNLAISTDITSWPPFWPDKLGDASDPGWKGSWNGYFGKKATADQESYYVMDDNNDDRFNYNYNNPYGVSFKPDSRDTTRNGLGLQVSVRGLQWAQFLAKDNIFWLYEITNTGTTDYSRMVFGMLIGTYVGVTGCDDSPQEYNNDWSFYDVTTNVTYTGNYPANEMRDPLWVGPVGMVGYAFLESPGNPYDGIDNDGDADTVTAALSAPYFSAADFDTTTIHAGDQIVLIDTNYVRSLYTVPSVDSVLVHTRGLYQWIFPGKTKVVEGNILYTDTGSAYVNPNALDGVDNNFNGLIDENYFIHFHQIKKSRTTTLLDILRPVRHIDYIHGFGTSPYSMIDEKRDDQIDNNKNWIHAFSATDQEDDVGRDGIPHTGDYGEADGLPTSGYYTSGSKVIDSGEPGEPHIDKTDVNESDQIGLTSFWYFTPSNQIALGDKNSLWAALLPGYFDVPSSIVNNRPTSGEDGDFIYGSGYFPLLAGTTERFSIALVYGGVNPSTIDGDVADLLKNKKTVQKIYDANYQFPQPPNKPTLTAVAGNHEVTLYWDRVAEQTIDPVLHTKSFEGYKIYRSTLPNFADLLTVTNALGDAEGYLPLAQFDLKDGITGYFQPSPALYQDVSGFSYYLGNDTGLVHTYVDKGVDNGRRYFYAIVAYSKGDSATGIFPAENTKIVTQTTTGELTHDINVAIVTPNAPVAGYVASPNGTVISKPLQYGTGTITLNTVNPAAVTGHPYRVTFLDTQVDGLDNNGNGLIDLADSTEWTRQTTSYSVEDMTTITDQFTSDDTSLVYLKHQNIVASGFILKDSHGAVVSSASYLLDSARGAIKASHAGALSSNGYTATYQYYPVFHDPNITGSPYVAENKDATIFDGVQFAFNNNWTVKSNDSLSGFFGKITSAYSCHPTPTNIPGLGLYGYAKPDNYDIVFSDSIVYTTLALFGAPSYQVNYRIIDVTTNQSVPFLLNRVYTSANRLAPNDEIFFYEPSPRGTDSSFTWDLLFSRNGQVDSIYNLAAGDTFKFVTYKPFRQGDVFQFTTVPPKADQKLAGMQLSRIRAVPNPYVTASALELPLPPGITSGRGTRKLEFIHLPTNCSIKIFTSRGDLVKTIYHDSNIEDGTADWDLRTEENLDVAFGIYFYVVESPAGTKSGKLAIIK